MLSVKDILLVYPSSISLRLSIKFFCLSIKDVCVVILRECIGLYFVYIIPHDCIIFYPCDIIYPNPQYDIIYPKS